MVDRSKYKRPSPAAIAIAHGDYHNAQDMQQEIDISMWQGNPFWAAKYGAMDEYRSSRYKHDPKTNIREISYSDVEIPLHETMPVLYPENFVVPSFEAGVNAINDVETFLAILKDREKEMLRLYYCEGWLDREIADIYKLSRPLISKIRKEAIAKIRKYYGIDVIPR